MLRETRARLFLFAIGFASLLFAGCASVPMDRLEEDSEAKTFATLPEKASLYIYRNEVFGAAIPMTVLLNGRNLGQTASKTYFHLNLLPGTYEIDSAAENTAHLSLELEANKNYFVWQEVKMGLWMARSALHQVEEEKGRAGVLESKLIKLQVPEQDILPIGHAEPDGSSIQKIRELHKLREEGIISEEEFQQKKQELLKSL